MKVLICNRHASHSLGGSEIQCDLIARHLHDQGHQVVYAAMESDAEPQGTSYAVEAIAEPSTPALYGLLRRQTPDLVYWRYNRNHFLRIGLLCQWMDIRCVFSISNPKDVEPWPAFTQPDSPWWTLQGARSRTRRTAQQMLGRTSYEGYRFFDGVVSLSLNLLHQVPDAPVGPRHRTSIYNSMEDQAVTPFFWPRHYVAWVANLKRCKNPDQFVALARRLRDLPVDFLMCGKIQHEEYRSIEDRGRLPENLFYLGPKSVPEVNGLLRGALCMVHTCDPEGFGNNFIQSWMQKTPTVSLYFDPDELIETRQVGFLSRTPSRFQRHVRRLCRDSSLRREMGNRARSFAIEHFHPDKNLPRFEAFFQQVLNDDSKQRLRAA